MNKIAVAACFGVSTLAVAFTAATAAPVAYGFGEATPGITAGGIMGLITALLSGAGGLVALFKSGTVSDFAKGTLADLTSKNASGLAMDASIVTIASVLFSKGLLDAETLTILAQLRKKIDAVKATP